MDKTMNAFLVDHFLKTEKEISLSDSTSINFSVTKDSASASSARFMIVFRADGALPVSFVSVNAFLQKKNVLVEWKVENETGLKEYEVEHSTDGTHFSLLATIAALNISKATYQFLDINAAAGNNYYRIKSLDKVGKSSYSPVVKIFNEIIRSSISVYPNPLVDDKISLQLVDQPAGKYQVRLFNSAGQEIFGKEIDHAGGNTTQIIKLNKNLPHGVYQLEIIIPGGGKQLIKVSR
jgi:hypothetical protein